MTRVQFLNDLYHHLYGMTREQAEQHLTYYAEMLADRMEEGMSEEEAVSSMEDVETIARRIMEEEGLPYTPPDRQSPAPPVYPDASRLGGGGGTRAYQAPKRRNWRKYAQIALWAAAILAVIGAVNRWRWNRVADAPREPVSTPGEERVDSSSGTWAYEMAFEEGYEYMEEEGPCLGVNSIDIEWASGLVRIQTWGGEGVQILEYAQSELTERTRRQVDLDGGVLNIRYRSALGLGNVKGAKQLTVLVPESFLGEIDVETTSAGVNITGVEADALRVHTASGEINIAECYTQTTELSTISGNIYSAMLAAGRADVSTTSGYVNLEAHSKEIHVSSVSGDIYVNLDGEEEHLTLSTASGDIWAGIANEALQDIQADSVSGDISFSLPGDMGYEVDFSTVSGHFSGGYASITDGKYSYNGGGCAISVNTVSGGLDIY